MGKYQSGGFPFFFVSVGINLQCPMIFLFGWFSHRIISYALITFMHYSALKLRGLVSAIDCRLSLLFLTAVTEKDELFKASH